MREEFSLNIENEEIVFADLTTREKLEAVAVCKSGNIFLFDLASASSTFLTKLPFSSVPTLEKDFDFNKVFTNLLADGDDLQNALNQIENIDLDEIPVEIDADLNLRLYSFADYVCLVENNGLNGVVLDLSNPEYVKTIERGKYCADSCSYPIAFYRRNSQTFLIHGTDWNRLDIIRLETDELLTERIVDHDTDTNYFDYFHSLLSVSPDAKHFVSNGWHWHPYGQITSYAIDDFLKYFELSYKSVELTDEPYNSGWDRPLCWVDENMLAVGFNKSIEDDEREARFPNELLFVDATENKIIDRIEFAGFANTFDGDVAGEVFYDRTNSKFIALNSQTGLFISDIAGREIYQDTALTSHKFSPKHKILYRIDFYRSKLEVLRINKLS